MSLNPALFNSESLLKWIQETDPEKLQILWDIADRTRFEHHGNDVHLRGIVEISNHCVRHCSYCGISADNVHLSRYIMSAKAILLSIEAIARSGCQTIVVQSGEHPGIDEDWIADLIKHIKARYDIAITLSLGEKSPSTLEKWKQAGADRYLLKMETSNPDLFQRHHPAGKQGFNNRLRVIKTLQELGYETGSGVILGLPGQTYDDLVNDLHFLQDLNLDMIAMGPYQPPAGTSEPAVLKRGANQVPNSDLLAHICIALTRLMNPKTHIPATAALAAHEHRDTRWASLTRGANVIMPNFTPKDFRQLYAIYPSSLRTNSLRGEDMVANIQEQLLEMGRSAKLHPQYLNDKTSELSSAGAPS